MITATKRWLRRNQTGFAVGFGVLGVTYVAGQYVLSKISEARERVAGDRIAKENLRRRFQQNQEDCTITVLELLPTMAQNVLEALPSESISKELQQKRSQRLNKSAGPSELSSGTLSAADEDGRSLSSFPSESFVHASQMEASSTGDRESRVTKSKAQLWNELKISSFTRAFTLIYSAALLNLLTRIQLNLLGRKSYLSNVISQTSSASQNPTIRLENREADNIEKSYGNDFETNRRYLTFSWWLLHRGWKSISNDVEAAVREIVGPLKPTEEIPLGKMSTLILDVRKRFEGSAPEERKTRKWLPYILPAQQDEDTVLRESGMSTRSTPNMPLENGEPGSVLLSDHASAPALSTAPPPLRRLLDETADLIDSPTFTHVLTLLLDAAFSHLVDQKIRIEAYNLSSLSVSSDMRVQDVSETDPVNASARLATIMAVMTREAHRIGNGVPNEYMQAMESTNDLEAFAAVVYSNNLEPEAAAWSAAN